MFTVEGAQFSYAIFGPIGLPELLLILLLALLLFGGKKLPEVARSMGQALRAFKDEANRLKSEVELEAEKESSKSPLEAKSATSAASSAEKDKPKVEPQSEQKA
jgi:sec-independent protein translocase protein TatA